MNFLSALNTQDLETEVAGQAVSEDKKVFSLIKDQEKRSFERLKT